MKHKYIQELFPNGELPWPYDEDDYVGFDSRDTYNLDYTLVCWLYERLRYFQDEASKVINFEYHTFEVDGESLTQRQCIDRMVKDCETIILYQEYAASADDQEWIKVQAAKDDLFKVLGIAYWSMWW